MKLTILLILLSLSLSSSELPFNANFRTNSEGTKIIYSSKLDLVTFKHSKLISILEQRYDTIKNESDGKLSIRYIYYW